MMNMFCIENGGLKTVFCQKRAFSIISHDRNVALCILLIKKHCWVEQWIWTCIFWNANPSFHAEKWIWKLHAVAQYPVSPGPSSPSEVHGLSIISPGFFPLPPNYNVKKQTTTGYRSMHPVVLHDQHISQWTESEYDTRSHDLITQYFRWFAGKLADAVL